MKRPGHEDESSASGATSESSSKRRKTNKNKENEDEAGNVEDNDSHIVHHNQPVLMSVFVEPVTQQEKLIIVATLPEGSTNVEFSVVGSEPGTRTARIEYSWPKMAFDIDAIFGKAIKLGLPSCHPKILAKKTFSILAIELMKLPEE